MENQHQPALETTQANPLTSSVQKKEAPGGTTPPPFQLKASEGFSPDGGPLQQSAAPEGPIQRLGRPSHPKEQVAGTCGLYSLAHSIAHLYGLDDANTASVRDLLLKAAGSVDKTVSAEGEITSFSVAETIVTAYNKLTEDYKISISQQTVDSGVTDEAGWRAALDINNGTSEGDDAATLAVDTGLYYDDFSEAEDKFDGSADVTENGSKAKVVISTANVVTVTGLDAANASTKGDGAHWINVTGVTSDYVEALDPNYPDFKFRFKVDEAAKLTTSFEAATRGEYLDTVYEGKGKEADWVNDMGGGGNQDWQTMTGSSDASTVKSTITDRLKNTDRTSAVSLNGLALKVTKA